MNKIVRNESAQTVNKHPITINFIIYHLDEQVLRIPMKSTDSSSDLLNLVRQKLARKFENIVGLASVQGYYTLDYALQVPDCKLAGMRNNQRLQLLFQEIVADSNGPSLADFCFLACLGEGVSACVFLVRHTASGKLCALKQIKKEYFRQFRTLETVLRQKKILCEIVPDLPLATKLFASFQSENHLNFLLEFYPGGQFFYHLSQQKLTQDEAKLCFAQILLTMEQLHQRKILYRDLKPENIMVDFEGHLILGDFGLCRINLEKQELAHSHCGSPEYMAYQTKQSQGYSYPADYYTMGALIHEMVRGVPPFYNGQMPSFEGTSQGFREIVQALIRQDPFQRLSNPQQLKRSKWLQGINWQKAKSKQLIMPIRLNFYANYIHSQFLQKVFDPQALRTSGKYDRLFDMFLYVNEKCQIAEWYPLARRSKKSNIKRGKSKQNSTHSNRGKIKSRNSSQSSDRSKSKQKSKGLNFKKLIKQPNIYQGFFQRQNTRIKIQQKKNDVSYKSSSKGKQHNYLTGKISLKQTKQLALGSKDQTIRMKSPITFKTLKSARSTDNLKASEYLRLLDKSASKRKKIV